MKEAAPAALPEPAGIKAPRRARKAKLRDEPQAETPVTEAVLPGDEPASETAGPDANAPGKARRGRRAKSQPAADPSMPADDRPDESVAAQPMADETTTPSTAAEAVPLVAPSSAAQWNAETGTVTFDWSAIEQVAASVGANQAMAKLLLAARAEGASSRWPF